MRILHVIDSLGPGGTEHSLLHLLHEYRTRHTFEVCALGPPYDLAERFEADGVPVHRLDLRTKHDWPAVLGKLRQVAQGRYDIIRAHLFHATLAVPLVAPKRPLRVVSFHGLDYDAFPVKTAIDRVRKRVHKAQVHRYDGWVGISEAVARHYESALGLRHVEVVHNPFPIDELDPARMPSPSSVRARYGVSEDAFLLVMPARYSSEKGHDILLAALGQLKDRGLAPRVLCFGRGPLRASLEAQCDRMGLSHVSLLEAVPQPEIYAVLHAADALVLPTPHGEGFGRAPAEAMALGKPVITARVGGALDFVKHDETGLLVLPHDAADLARAIARLMQDAPLRIRLGEAGARLIRSEFHVAKMVETWERYFDTLLRTRGRG